MNQQSVASVARQVLAILVSVVGVLTAALPALHFPAGYAWLSGVLTAFAPVLLTLEHYLGDPSTGTPVVGNPPPVAPVPTPVPPVPPAAPAA